MTNRIILSISVIMALVFISPVLVNAQVTSDTTEALPPQLYPSLKDPYRFEIGRIEMIGNKAYESEEILQYVIQRPTTSGVLEDFVILYMEMTEENGHLGQLYENMLKETYQNLDIDFGFYSESATETDSGSIHNFYQMQGYHEIEVSAFFFPDTVEEENVLLFKVEEGPRYSLDTIVYSNISLLDSTVIEEIRKARTLKSGIPYVEDEVYTEVIEVKSALMNNGYYTVYFDKPDVIRDTINKTDSIWVNMHFGRRLRFGEISYNHQLNGQSKVANELVDDLLEFKEGDYYSKKDLDNSEGNLLSLRTFELLSIDTIRTPDYDPQDTIIPFKVYMSYKPQNELALDLGLVEKVEGYEFLNIRGRAVYENINILGAAQTYGANVTYDIRDINRYINSGFSGDAFEWEGQLGFLNYYQPILFKLGKNRVGMNVIGNYGVRNAGIGAQSQLVINTLGLGVKFPVDFASDYWLNNFTFEVYGEKQRPIVNKRIDENNSALVNTAYFEQAQEYNEDNPLLPTAIVFSTSIFHDTRNDLFDPSGGLQFSTQLDITPPGVLTQYIKGQVNFTNYLDIGWNSILASKVRLGHIYFYGNPDNNYISVARQFFAGGPNSNRGWDPRRLRYRAYSPSEIENDLELTERQYRFFQDFVGNESLIETSIEYRYRFHEIKSLPPGYSDFLKDLGLVAFADIGNSYGWLIDRGVGDENLNISDFIRNLAFSSGLGFRYFTPFGPIRIDLAFPIYGPIETEYQWISEVAPFEYLQFNLGLQHAF